MDFLEKLNYLMEQNHLNKNTLSKSCNIPYTTIDGWYKKGYEGLKLTTLKKLANFFETPLDFWASEDDDLMVLGKRNKPFQKYPPNAQELLNKTENLNTDGLKELNTYADYLLSQEKYRKIKVQEKII